MSRNEPLFEKESLNRSIGVSLAHPFSDCERDYCFDVRGFEVKFEQFIVIKRKTELLSA